MPFQRIRRLSSQRSQSPSTTSQVSPQPFSVQEPQHFPSQKELENQGFNQDNFEATGLQLKATYGTITPIEQERLGVLQAKMDSFWTERMEQAKAQPNLLEILARNPQSTQVTEATAPLQPQLTIGQPQDHYEQEADRVASQVVEQIHTPTTAQSPQGKAVQRQDEKGMERQAKPEITGLQLNAPTVGFSVPQFQRIVQRDGTDISDPAMSQALALTNDNYLLAAAIAPLIKQWGEVRIGVFLGAFPTGIKDAMIATEMVGFLDSGGTGEQAQYINTVFPNAAQQQRQLMGLFLSGAMLDDVKWAMGAVGNDVEKAEAALSYLEIWKAQGAAAENLARIELAKVSGDVSLATVVMNLWSTYNFDPDLRAWVGKRAAEIAQNQLEDEGKLAEARKQEYIKTNAPEKPNIRKGKPNQSQQAKLNKIKKVTETAEETWAKEMEQAALLVPGWTEAEAGKMESFLNAAAKAGAKPEAAKSALQLTDGNIPLAEALLDIFAIAGLAPEAAPATALWALDQSKNPDNIRKLALILAQGLAATLDLALAKSVSQWLLNVKLSAENQSKVISAAVAAPSAWPQVEQFLTKNDARLAHAVYVLEWAVQGGTTTIGDLVDWIDTRTLDDIRWALESQIAAAGSATTTEANSRLELLEKAKEELKDKKAKEAITEILLKCDDFAQAKRLLQKINSSQPKPSRIVEIMALDGAVNGTKILEWIENKKIPAIELYDHLVTKKLTYTTLDDLLDTGTTWKQIEELLPQAKDKGNETWQQAGVILLTNINKMPNASELQKQVKKYKGKHQTNMTRTVDACLSHGVWNQGTFPDAIESLLYHYAKHVIDEGGGGGADAQTVAQYSAASRGPIARWAQGYASAEGGWKITQRGGGPPGGIYTDPGRETLSFWQA
ncbi:hypothetical protein [Leptolyngbya sp. PCC 6406]|uniref:hypothetical protein n=1 Tax=Leptolyngbya sp. PCC 6406 TaxID=1173264 RepID=UPI0002ABAE0E|nr:hypothetical protein [Leptolyngbya sp. PCC 6406]